MACVELTLYGRIEHRVTGSLVKGREGTERSYDRERLDGTREPYGPREAIKRDAPPGSYTPVTM